jgi:hypothetical protein
MPMQNIIPFGVDQAASSWFELEPGQITTVLVRTQSLRARAVLEIRDADGGPVAAEVLGAMGRSRVLQIVGPGEYRVTRPASDAPLAVDRY